MKSAKVTGYGHVFDGIYDQVIVCAASQSAFRRAIDSTRPRGVISLVAAPTVLKGPDPTPLWYREISVRGIYNYAPVRWQGAWVHPYEVLLPALADRRLAFADFVTHEYPLAEYNEALTALHRRSASGAIKVVFKPAIDLHD
jgi:threonine dehydrogenase-like Zn-dependent dehydrogenase